ncbi:MAG: hypothetical protein AB1516_04145 [Pseudomonadota bacterium]
MSYLTKKDQKGKTRQIGKRGFRKGSYFTHLLKSAPEGKSVVDSRHELIAGYAMDLDPRIKTLQVQPFTLDVTTGEMLHTKDQLDRYREKLKTRGRQASLYTPDFALTMQDQSVRIIEIKDAGWIDFTDSYSGKIEAATELLKVKGIHFEILAGSYEDTLPCVQNLKLLHSINHQMNAKEVPASLLDLTEKLQAVRVFAAQMHESAEMLSVSEIADGNRLTVTQVCMAIVMGIFDAPIWREVINKKTLLSGAADDSMNCIRYEHFDLRRRT